MKPAPQLPVCYALNACKTCIGLCVRVLAVRGLPRHRPTLVQAASAAWAGLGLRADIRDRPSPPRALRRGRARAAIEPAIEIYGACCASKPRLAPAGEFRIAPKRKASTRKASRGQGCGPAPAGRCGHRRPQTVWARHGESRVGWSSSGQRPLDIGQLLITPQASRAPPPPRGAGWSEWLSPPTWIINERDLTSSIFRRGAKTV